jgi:membrane-associated phospholipid phosphatase
MARRWYLRFEKSILIAGVAAFFVGGYLGISYYTSRFPAHSLATPLDRAIPYVPAAWPLYQAVYLLVLLPTRLFSRASEMRAGFAANIACMASAYGIFLLFPVRLLPPASGAEAMAAVNAGSAPEGLAPAGNFAFWFDDRGMNCFPSLHVALAAIAALCCARRDARLGAAAWTLTALIALASLLLKRHYLVDIPAGLALGVAAYALFLRGRLQPAPAR